MHVFFLIVFAVVAAGSGFASDVLAIYRITVIVVVVFIVTFEGNDWFTAATVLLFMMRANTTALAAVVFEPRQKGNRLWQWKQRIIRKRA